MRLLWVLIFISIYYVPNKWHKGDWISIKGVPGTLVYWNTYVI